MYEEMIPLNAELLNRLLDDELTVNSEWTNTNLTFSQGFYIQDFKLTKLPNHACTAP